MAKKKTITHAGVTAEIEEDINEHISVKKPQVQPQPEKYWTKDSGEAEELVKKGFKLVGVFSPYCDLPKRWVFEETKKEIFGEKPIKDI